ncbi:MAG: dihydrofolate reductase family protein [Actinomycetota bacterium]
MASLDGYVADEDGNFDWAEPDEEVHTFVNDLERPVGTYLLGRRLCEVLVAWETISLDDQPPHIRDFAEIWRAAHKVVVDEWHLLVAPIVVGGGTWSLPEDVRLELHLVDVRRFGNGIVHVRYGTKR